MSYAAVDPPFGRESRDFPVGAGKFTIEGKTYLQAGDVFFRVVSDAKGASYIVVPPPYGWHAYPEHIRQLPALARRG